MFALRLSCLRKLAVTWILARGFAYLLSFFSQILDFIHWTVLIFISIYFEWIEFENQRVFTVSYTVSETKNKTFFNQTA